MNNQEIFEKCQPILNNWFQTTFNAEGEGVAEFENPKAKIYGKTRIDIEETGNFTINFIVDNYECEEELIFGINQIFTSDKPTLKDGKLFLLFPPKQNNKVKKLTISVPGGYYIAQNFEYYSTSTKFISGNKSQNSIEFLPPKLIFKSNDEETPSYWILPLLNFIPTFCQKDSRFSNHPLRIFLDGKVPVDCPEDKLGIAHFFAEAKNRLISFDHLGSPCFIEGLPDFDERRDQLIKKKAASCITSLVVGEIGINDFSLEKYHKWFPLNIPTLLDFLTNSGVGFPWVEFRGKSGKVNYRYFERNIRRPFSKGRSLIDEGIHHSMGIFLTKSLASEEVSKSYFRTALALTTSGSRSSQFLDDQLSNYCRAVDAICAYYGFKTQNLLSALEINNQTAVKLIISQARKSITKLNKRIKEEDQKNVIARILGRLSNVINIDNNFGIAIEALLEKFGLLDHKILNQYFLKISAYTNFSNWSAMVNKYRNDVIHNGFIDFQDPNNLIEDVFALTIHLYDILCRIIFKIIDYDKQYLPPVIRVTTSESVYWVNQNTLPSSLGYGPEESNYYLMEMSVTPSKESSKDNQ